MTAHSGYALDEIVDAWVSGARFTFIAMIILVLAWSMSEISRELHTADFLIASLGDSLPAAALPATIFVLAAFTGFFNRQQLGRDGHSVASGAASLLGDHGHGGPHRG
jgi:Na+/H+ antiporter NhaC